MNETIIKTARQAFNLSNVPVYGVAINGEKVFILATTQIYGTDFSGVFELKPKADDGYEIKLGSNFFRRFVDAQAAFERFVRNKPHATTPEELEAVLSTIVPFKRQVSPEEKSKRNSTLNEQIVNTLRKAFDSDNPPVYGVAIDGNKAFVLATLHEKYYPNREAGHRHEGWQFSGIFRVKPNKRQGCCELEILPRKSFTLLEDAQAAFEKFAMNKLHATTPEELKAILPPEPEHRAKVISIDYFLRK